MSARSQALAARIEEGAKMLAEFAATLSEAEWQQAVPGDGRAVGIIVHHVADVYPAEIKLAQALASGRSIERVTREAIVNMNAKHASEHGSVQKEETIETLRHNSKAAAEAVRAFTDEELDRAAPVALNAHAPLTTQFIIEDHAVRHSWAHLARIRAAVGR
jgi:hypothetical protein